MCWSSAGAGWSSAQIQLCLAEAGESSAERANWVWSAEDRGSSAEQIRYAAGVQRRCADVQRERVGLQRKSSYVQRERVNLQRSVQIGFGALKIEAHALNRSSTQLGFSGGVLMFSGSG